MAKIKENEYYKGFNEGVEYACKAAQMLRDTLQNFDPATLDQKMSELHAIEHEADAMKHRLMKKLIKEFITPIEREDIMALSNNIDDVIDAIDDVLMHIYMNNITVLRTDVIAFTDLIIHCCNTLKLLMNEFPNFKKSDSLKHHIIELNNLEEEGDRMYMDAMRRLHTNSSNPLEILTWRGVYGYLEKCCDACEHTADVVETVVMKNT